MNAQPRFSLPVSFSVQLFKTDCEITGREILACIITSDNGFHTYFESAAFAPDDVNSWFNAKRDLSSAMGAALAATAYKPHTLIKCKVESGEVHLV